MGEFARAVWHVVPLFLTGSMNYLSMHIKISVDDMINMLKGSQPRACNDLDWCEGTSPLGGNHTHKLAVVTLASSVVVAADGHAHSAIFQ